MKMSNVETHLLEDKMDEAVTHYINSHPSNEPIHIDTNGIPMTVQDDGAGRVTIMHQQTYTTQMCRQVSVTEQVGDGPWGEELLEGPIAAIVAHLQNPRHHPPLHHKVAQVRSDVDSSVILDGTIRFNGQTLEQQPDSIVVELPPMQTLPPLQDMKRCAETDWFSEKNKKDDQPILQDSESPCLEMGAGASPAQHKQSRKSLPHKKRISRKLKRNNGSSTPQQELVVINCTETVPVPPEQEQILPDSYVSVPQHHHMSHEMRPMFICQICGDYYGEEQLKFYHHLKQHYEPHTTIIIENPVPDLAMDKMANNCIVDNVATLPDSIVELSLENTVPKTMYQPIDKHILYTSSDKTLTYNSNKMQYSMASMDKEPPSSSEAEKTDLYETLDKLELYNCGKCSKTFRKQKHCEAHMREAHTSNTKLEDMGEFSEPEDLMAGIQVCVGDGETYDQTLLPHLTVENGHVHQEHTRQWYGRGGACAAGYCTVCARENDAPLRVLKEEVLQRIFDSEVSDNANFADNMISDHEHNDHNVEHEHADENAHRHEDRHVVLQEQDEHDNEHSESSGGHNEHSHDNNEHSLGHNDQSHDHKDFFLGRSENSQEHKRFSAGHNGHEEFSMGHNGHSHSDNDNRHSHNDNDNGNNRDNKDSIYDVPLEQRKLSAETAKCATSRKSKLYGCHECARVFTHRNSLLYHVLSHGKKQHSCRDCDKCFYTLGALKIHARVHNGDRPYKCDICGREFRQWTDLKNHKISVHTDKKSYKCDFCGKGFARRYSLNLHVRIHTGEKNYKCDFCTKSFRCSSYKIAHMRTHTGDRPYKCEECEKSYRSSFDLRRHVLVHEKVRNRFEENEAKNKLNQKKTKIIDSKEEKIVKYEPPPKKVKQIAVASTAKQSPAIPVQTIAKKVQKPKKTPKKGAPNVTVQNRDGQFKVEEYAGDVEVYDNRECAKFKNVYSDSDGQVVYENQELAILRPIYKGPGTNVPVELLNQEKSYRTLNTDGKMHIFTHVEKVKDYNGSIVTNTQVLGDIRSLEKEVAREVRSEIAGEGIETGFLERLTAMYNIPAV